LLEQDEEEEVTDEPIVLDAKNPPTLNEAFGIIADSLSGFGGFYIDEVGQPTVYMQEPGQHDPSRVEEVLKSVMGENILERGQGPRRTVSNPQINIREGNYSMNDLLSWFENLDRIMAVEQVVFTDLNEFTNRLTVGVTSLEIRSDIEGLLQEQEIPLEAVSIVQAELPREQGHGLRNNVNPPRGGIEIGYRTGPSSASACTYGFTGRLNGNEGFLTNSHCTAQRGTVTGQAFNNPRTGPKLGDESVDPNYFTCGFFQNSACRYSDAAFVDFDSGINGIRKIAQTQSWASPNSGSATLNLNHGSSSLDLRGYDTFPVDGEMVDKVGRTTGWTYGYVNRTCYNTRVGNGSGGRARLNGNLLLMKCQYRANYTSNSGDSGSPIFHWHGNEVTIMGIHWGGGSGNAVFSALGGIQKDF
jgi:hypothetical protein